MRPMTKGAKLGIVLILAIAGFFGVKWFAGTEMAKTIIPQSDQSVSDLSNEEQEKIIKVCVVTWGGYAGGQYFNEGFKASKESRFYKDYGILVEFKLIDDFNASREAFKAGEVDLLWQTADAFPTEVEGLKEFNPQILFQADWSRGGDAIVVRQGINSVADLRGKKIAVAPMTPSHTFLLSLFKAGEIKISDVQIVEVANAIDAADLFKKGQVDAAVCWSPDDQACIQSVAGSKILLSTKTAKNIIADIFFAKKDFIEKHEKELTSLVEGWLKGSAEINSSEDAKKKASKILAQGLNQPEDFCYNAINNARLCTYGDNVNFFNINGTYKGVSGEELYSNMSMTYANAGVIKNSNTPSWRTITYPSIIKRISLNGQNDLAEGDIKFSPVTEQEKTVTAFSDKKVTISFVTGSSVLDDNAKYIIDKEFADIAKGFSGAKIRIEGNTDNTGNRNINKTLSEKRAQAVANYLMNAHGFDNNRFIVVGNGPNKPVADNTTQEGKSKNRRTDFQLISQ